MLLTISFIIILIIGVACSVIYNYRYIDIMILDYLGLLFIVMGIIGTITCGMFILHNITEMSETYEELYEEKTLLEAVDIKELNTEQQYIYYTKVRKVNTIIIFNCIFVIFISNRIFFIICFKNTSTIDTFKISYI